MPAIILYVYLLMNILIAEFFCGVDWNKTFAIILIIFKTHNLKTCFIGIRLEFRARYLMYPHNSLIFRTNIPE
jgi:hypothetical protein